MWAVAILLAMVAIGPCRRHSPDSSLLHTKKEHSLEPFATTKERAGASMDLYSGCATCMHTFSLR